MVNERPPRRAVFAIYDFDLSDVLEIYLCVAVFVPHKTAFCRGPNDLIDFAGIDPSKSVAAILTGGADENAMHLSA